MQTSKSNRMKQQVMHRSQSQDTGLRGKASSAGTTRHCHHRPLMPSSSRVPGHATILKHSEGSHLMAESADKGLRTSDRRRTSSSPSSPKRHGSRSRESSPRQHTASTSSEEIPLEDLSRIHSSRHGSPNIRRRSTSGLPQARISAPPGLCHLHPQNSNSHSTNSTTSLNEKACLQTASERTPDELFTAESSTENQQTPKPTSEVQHSSGPSPTEVCIKPCCAAEQSNEKFHPDSGPAPNSSLSDAMQSPPSSSNKIKGAIQTV